MDWLVPLAVQGTLKPWGEMGWEGGLDKSETKSLSQAVCYLVGYRKENAGRMEIRALVQKDDCTPAVSSLGSLL